MITHSGFDDGRGRGKRLSSDEVNEEDEYKDNVKGRCSKD